MLQTRMFLIVLLAVLAPVALAATTPATPEAWLAQMLDAKKNGAAFKDPAVFAEWLDAVTEPRFMTALAVTAVDPATYPKVLADAIDPAATRNWLEFTDPQLYLRWMLASASPSFQQAIISRMTDPAKMKRWIEIMARPDGYVPAARAMQPVMPMAWFAAMGGQVTGQEWLKLPAGRIPGVSSEAEARYRY